MRKLYLIGRSDLPPGLRAAQVCHAMRLFADEHSEEESHWYETSNTIVLLETADENSLSSLASLATARRVPYSLFREPDRNDEATAIALGPKGHSLCRNLPLMHSEQ